MKKYLLLTILIGICTLQLKIELCAQNYTEPFKEVPEVPAGKAVVYIYRPKKEAVVLKRKYHFSVNADQERISTSHLYARGYLIYFADPGKNEIWAQSGADKSIVILNAEAGKKYFIEAKLKTRAVNPIPLIKLKQIQPEQALKKINKCKLLVETNN